MSALFSSIAILLCSFLQLLLLNRAVSVPTSFPPQCLGNLADLRARGSGGGGSGGGVDYCTPERFIEIEFKLRFGCHVPPYIDQGVRLEVSKKDDGGTNMWESIRFYTPSLSLPPTESLVRLEEGNTSVMAVAFEYNSSLPLILVNNTSEAVTIREYLCGGFIPYTKEPGKKLRIRWMQRYLSNSSANFATWALDDIRIRIWNGTCFTLAVDEGFSDAIPSGFQEKAGVVRTLPCEESEERVLYFRRDANETSDIPRRSLIVSLENVMERCEERPIFGRNLSGGWEGECPLRTAAGVGGGNTRTINCSHGSVECGCGQRDSITGRLMCSPPIITEAPPITTASPMTTEAPTETPMTTETPPITTETPPVTTDAPPMTTDAPPITTVAPPATTETPPPTTETPPTTEIPSTTETAPTTTETPPITTVTPPTTTETLPTITTSPRSLIDNIFKGNLSQGGLDDLIQLFRNGSATHEISERIISNVGALLQGISYEEDEDAGGRLLSFLDTFALSAFNSSQGPIETESYVVNVQDVSPNDISASNGLDALKEDTGSINIPRELIDIFPSSNNQPIRIASFLFKNISNILSQETVDNNESMIVSPVISTTLGCGDGRACLTRDINLKKPIRIEIKHHKEIINGDLDCYFYDIERSIFSKEGCHRDLKSSNSTHTVCECNHLTHFAILLSPGLNITGANRLALNIIGYVGVAISLIAMAITIFILCFLKSLWGMRNYIHINLCICLSISQLLFITAIDKVDIQPLCQTIAIVLHYFFLVTFMWMLMEGVVLYVALVRVFIKSQKNYIILFTLVSYGLPALYMFLVVPLGMALRDDEGRPHYGTSEYCWLRYDTNFVFAFIAPVIVIILANIGFFIMAITIMIKHEKKGEKKSKFEYANRWLRTSISLLVVMGITWLIGVLVFHQAFLFVAYIFTIATAFQGTIIFILFIVLSKQVRESYFSWWRSKKSESSVLSSMFATEMNMSLGRGRFSSMRSTIRGTFRRTGSTYHSSSVKEESQANVDLDATIAKYREAFESEAHHQGDIAMTDINPPKPNVTVPDVPNGHVTPQDHTPDTIKLETDRDVVDVTPPVASRSPDQQVIYLDDSEGVDNPEQDERNVNESLA